MLVFSIALHGACEDCLIGDGWLKNFWCADADNLGCLPKERISECKNVESHDLVLNATKCCSTIASKESCLSNYSVSFCLWCPDHIYNGVAVAGTCMYNDDYLNINKNCKTNPDITSFCSDYHDCATCADDVVCSWCPLMGRCITAILSDMEYPLDEYKCINGTTKICCESYKDCSTCSAHSGTIQAQICTWCQTNQIGDGKCMTHDQAIIEPTCQAINELGKQYCSDECYLSGPTCSSCIGISGCIWLDKIDFVDKNSTPPITSICAPGGSKGPKEAVINYEAAIPMPYYFNVISYNYMTCSMSAKALNTLIISVLCSLLGIAIIVYVVIMVYRRMRYNRIIRENAKREVTEDEKKLLQQKQEEFDIEDFMITIQAVSWTD